MIKNCYGCLFCAIIILINGIPANAANSIIIDNQTNIPDLYKYIMVFEDPSNKLTIESILEDTIQKRFAITENSKLNFEFSPSTFWLKLCIKNESNKIQNYVFKASNPDLNFVFFYEVVNDSICKKVETGELFDTKTRDIYNRNYAFRINLEPNKLYSYYLAVNNSGNPLFIPLEIEEYNHFQRIEIKTDLIYWLIYGLLLFIFVFNLYLYRSTKDRINLYYALYVLFATLFLLNYDGYYFFFNPPIFFAKIKFINPSLYIVFLVSFTQLFTDYSQNLMWIKRFLNPFKYVALGVTLFYFFKFPLSLVTDICMPIIILIVLVLLIAIATASFQKKYLPSHFFLVAYIIMFIGIITHELKEYNILSVNFFTSNSIKFGLTLECTLLTVAVLERFRINQENAKKTIEESYRRIDLQNQELEFINVELEKLSIVASETDNCVAIYDSKGRLEWCNTGFERFYESRLDELIRDKKDYLEQIVTNKDIKSLFQKCLTEKTPVAFESRVITKTKKQKWVQTTLSPFQKGGNIHKVIAVDSDITNLKEYQRELKISKNKAEESDRLKTIFLGNMSHEIRTPLNGILGFSELLQRQDLSPERKENYLRMIMSNGDQLIRIIDDIVDISLIESNQLKIKAEDVSLKQLIDETCDFFEIYKSTVDKQHITILKEFNIDKKYDIIHVDKHRLKQVLTNLMRNALKFTVDGTVILKCIVKEDQVQFCVEDTGIGIDPAKKDLVFERFRQGEESLSRRFGGTGLGLSISKGILDKMGGTIWIDSSYTNGLRICFSVPSVSVQTISYNDTPNASDRLKDKIRDKRILVVEDHDTSFDYLVELLSPFDPTLSRAHNGKQAVELARKKVFDIVLMDINLPELDGMAATREIRKFDQKVPIIAQTAYAMESEKETILASGCNDIISKPISSNLFYSILASHL